MEYEKRSEEVLEKLKESTEEKIVDPISTPEYHLGDVEAVNNLIRNNSLNWPLNDPASWPTTIITWHTSEHEEGMGRRINRLNLNDRGLTGTVDLRQFEYLTWVSVSNNPITAVDVSGMKNLRQLICNQTQITDFDVSNLELQLLSLSNIQNLTSVNMKGAKIEAFAIVNCFKVKQFTDANGDTLTLETNGSGEINFRGYNNNLKQFTLEARSTGNNSDSGFSHWIATPNDVGFVSPNTNLSSTTIFTIPEGVDTKMTAWFDPAPIVSAPVINKDSITATGASFSGEYNVFGRLRNFGYQYRKKGEDDWKSQPDRLLVPLGIASHEFQEYSGSFKNDNTVTGRPEDPVILEPGTTYELRVYFGNSFGLRTYSDVTEFTTSWAVTVRHVETKRDGEDTFIDEEIVNIPDGEKINIVAGNYPGLAGVHYKLMREGSDEIENTTYPLGTNLSIHENTTIVVYHASTIVDILYPIEMEFYANYSDRGTITTKEDYAFVNRSALPAKVNLKHFDVIENDGVNFVANALHDGDLHFTLLPAAINNNGFNNSISNIQPNIPLNRNLGTLGGYALGGNDTGSFRIGGKYIGLFPVQPRSPKLQFVFSFEIDWDLIK